LKSSKDVFDGFVLVFYGLLGMFIFVLRIAYDGIRFLSKDKKNAVSKGGVVCIKKN
jgi:hypothetical protein